MFDSVAAIALAVGGFLTALFQLAIVFGAPLGEYSYGGAKPGRLATNYRIASVFSFLVMTAIGLHYLAQVNLLPQLLMGFWNSLVNWLLVGFFALSAVANNITKSKKERMVWALPTIIFFVCSLVIAL